MSDSTTQPVTTYAIPGDVYRVQRRPGHQHLVVNDDYEGVRIVDAWTGRAVSRIGFPQGYDPSGIIDAWCFRQDGKAALAVNEESGNACLLPLEGDAPAYSLKFPLRGDLRYLWQGDSFWITSGKSTAFYRLEWRDGIPVLAEKTGMEALGAARRWRTVVDRLPSYECNVLRVEPDVSRMLFHDFSSAPGRLGAIRGAAAEEGGVAVWSAPAPHDVPALAFHADTMFLLQKGEVWGVNEQGERLNTFAAAEGTQNVGFDTIAPAGGRPAALVIVSSSYSDSSVTQAAVYEIR